MSAVAPPLLRSGLARRAGSLVLVGAAAAAFALFTARALADLPPAPLGPAMAGGIALLALLGLALARLDAAAALGFALFGVVFLEPAPSDAIFATVMAVALVTGRFRLERVPFGAGLLLAAFLALNLLSAMSAVEPLLAGQFFAITLYLAVFGAWVAGWVDTEARSRLLLRSLLLGAAVSAALGSLAPFVALPGGDMLHSAGRAKAFFADPNVFGPFMVLASVFVLSELLEPRLLRSSRAAKVGLLLLLAVGALLSYSRAAWLNAGIAALTMAAVYALRRGGGRKAFAIFLSLIGALGAFAVVLAVTGSIDFLRERARLQSYDSDRFAGQESGLELVGRYPFGVGPGQFEEFIDISAHSTYIRILAEQGVLGLVAILALFLLTLLLAARNAASGRDTYGIGSAPLLGAWAGLLANSAFVDTLHWRHLWLVAGLIWAGSLRGAWQR